MYEYSNRQWRRLSSSERVSSWSIMREPNAGRLLKGFVFELWLWVTLDWIGEQNYAHVTTHCQNEKKNSDPRGGLDNDLYFKLSIKCTWAQKLLGLKRKEIADDSSWPQNDSTCLVMQILPFWQSICI